MPVYLTRYAIHAPKLASFGPLLRWDPQYTMQLPSDRVWQLDLLTDYNVIPKKMLMSSCTLRLRWEVDWWVSLMDVELLTSVKLIQAFPASVGSPSWNLENVKASPLQKVRNWKLISPERTEPSGIMILDFHGTFLTIDDFLKSQHNSCSWAYVDDNEEYKGSSFFFFLLGSHN